MTGRVDQWLMNFTAKVASLKRFAAARWAVYLLLFLPTVIIFAVVQGIAGAILGFWDSWSDAVYEIKRTEKSWSQDA